jgi:phosphoribosylamine---glycine ligase
VKVLVLGGGGREHALARSLSLDPDVATLHCAPGNPGTSALAENHVVNVTDPVAVRELAVRIRTDLVVIGPEAPLFAGVADELRHRGIPCFGPDRASARLEGSKAFAKEVMEAAGVPTARSRHCDAPAQVRAALEEFGAPYVIKADGPASGKGVLVTEDRAAAERHAAQHDRVVVEEYLDGPELSLFALCDGTNAVPLLPARDFKRLGDRGEGPNTGGMGAYAPVHEVGADLVEECMAGVVRPTVAEMSRRGLPYQGLLYVGLALTADGPRVIEFNARFGDPETQVVLDRLASPLGTLLQASATGALRSSTALEWHPGAAVCVVLAAEGYPGDVVTGDLLHGLDQAEAVDGAYVLHAGTAWSGLSDIKVAGGRVLNVVGTGDDLTAARSSAYEAIRRIDLRGGHYRGDIAQAAPGDA